MSDGQIGIGKGMVEAMIFPALLARAALDGLLAGVAMSAVIAVSGWINPVL